MLLPLFFSGCCSASLTSTTSTVSEPLGGILSVLCNYTEPYQTNNKYWCRGKVWKACQKVIETTESATFKKDGRISINDNRSLHIFRVITENLTLGDADTYWCGINVPVASDPSFSITVNIFKGKFLF